MNKKKYEFAKELIKELQSIHYSKMSISNLCKSLHCSRQSFYYYFDTIDDCLVYYLNETFKLQIRTDYLISGLFNFANKNADFINECMKDDVASNLLWSNLFNYIKDVLNNEFFENIDDYVGLYIEQKEALTSFYAAGFLEQLKSYVINKHFPSADKCIKYCLAIFGATEDVRNLILRMAKN